MITDLAALRARMHQVVVAQDRVIDALLVGVIAKGHVLLEGVPGLAKTLIAKTLARALGMTFRRIQFTPDLMPSDVLGTVVFSTTKSSKSAFQFKQGPIFTNVLLADEINRTPPKTQSALLEAMEEGTVTVEGISHPLPSPFLVIATENPIEHEGTYPLPEAQLDRFLLKVVMTYPTLSEEEKILEQHRDGFDPHQALQTLAPVATAARVQKWQQHRSAITVSQELLSYMAALTRASREHRDCLLGASPRAATALLKATQAHALLGGNDFATPDNVKAVAPWVLAHRLLIKPEAEVEGIQAGRIVQDLLETVPVPR